MAHIAILAFILIVNTPITCSKISHKLTDIESTATGVCFHHRRRLTFDAAFIVVNAHIADDFFLIAEC
jgi:hypothetical protein